MQASAVAEKIRAALSDPYWLSSNAQGSTKMIHYHQLGASIGLVLFDKDADPVNLLKRADKAMYHAKEAGRNQIFFHEEAA